MTKATEDAIRDLGKLDVLVNNAGIAGLNVPTVDYGDGKFKPPFLSSLKAAEWRCDRSGGSAPCLPR